MSGPSRANISMHWTQPRPWSCVPGVPDDEQGAPHVVNGQFHADAPNHQLTPATWTEFTRYGIAVRGPAPGQLGITVPRDRLNEWTLGNLNTYWQRQAYRDWVTCAELALHIVEDANNRWAQQPPP